MSNSRSQDLNRLIGLYSPTSGNDGVHYHRTVANTVSDGEVLDVSTRTPQPVTEETQQAILKQLQIMNQYLAIMTDNQIRPEDVPG